MGFSREQVMAALERAEGPQRRPASARQLLRELGGRREEVRELRGLLRGLVKSGAVERAYGGYRRPGAGEPAEEPRRRSARRAAPSRPGGGRPAARPALAAGPEGWVGIASAGRRVLEVRPYPDDGAWWMRVEPQHAGRARPGEVVVVAPLRAGGGRGRGGPRGRVVRVLGRPGEPEADYQAMVFRHGLPTAFPAACGDAAAAMDAALDPAELARRVDLRERPLVTIDPATARDHDDAVWVEPDPGGGARLWVAIADVAHYVREGGALDREALERGNSVYFPDRAIPMLPERLSGDLCSLRPGVDRLAMAVELAFGREGDVQRRSFYPAVIRSRASLTYEEAQAVMEGGSAGLAPAIERGLRDLADLARRLMHRRFAEGSIDFDLPSAEIVLGSEGTPVDIVETPRTIAHRAIEEAMLAANRAVAELLEASGVPAVYRVHEPPDPEALASFQGALRTFGLAGEERRPARGVAVTAEVLRRALERTAGRPEARIVHLLALRSMKQARYEPEDRGHFALAFDAYTHFTSPIRRYADLVVHRALKRVLSGEVPGSAPGRRGGARAKRLAAVAETISDLERRAMGAERQIVDLKKCAFLAGREGEVFEGSVTGVTAFGLFVTLDGVFADGLVHVSSLPGYFDLEEREVALVERRGERRFRLADRVRVRIERVDLAKGRIRLAWVEAEGRPPPRRRGRPRPSGGEDGAPETRRKGRARGRARRRADDRPEDRRGCGPRRRRSGRRR